MQKQKLLLKTSLTHKLNNIKHQISNLEEEIIGLKENIINLKDDKIQIETALSCIEEINLTKEELKHLNNLTN